MKAGSVHLAEDAAQQAFAKKAAIKLPQLRRKSQFASWRESRPKQKEKSLPSPLWASAYAETRHKNMSQGA